MEAATEAMEENAAINEAAALLLTEEMRIEKEFWDRREDEDNRGRSKKLKGEIAVLKKEMFRYVQAEANLREGSYELAISLLGELAENVLKYLPQPSVWWGIEGVVAMAAVPERSLQQIIRFQEIMDVQRGLVSLREKKAISALA